MSVHIHRRSGAGWTQLSNELLRDPRMSFKARGVLVTLLSHEDGWQQSMAYTLTEATDGRDATRTALVELERLGYVTRVRKQAQRGRWITDVHVYDYAKWVDSPASDAPTTDNPTPDGPTTEQPTPETPALEVKALDVEALDVEPLEESKSAKAPSTKVTEDQLYLAKRFTESWGYIGNVTPAAIQKLNNEYGTVRVTDAMRQLRGFPPNEDLRSAYAYVEHICKMRIEAEQLAPATVATG